MPYPVVYLRQSTPESAAPKHLPRFYHYSQSPRNQFIQYLGTDWANAKDPREALREKLCRLRGVQNLIVANEAFVPGTSRLRNNAPHRALGDEWITLVCADAALEIPNTRVWLNEFRPRDLAMWAGLLAYVDAHHPKLDGIGIQAHASLISPYLPTHWASPVIPSLVRYHCGQIQSRGLGAALSEVTCWSDSEAARGRWYRHMWRLAQQERVEWINFWSPTPADAWHWKTHDNPPPCHLWDNQGRWLWEDWNLGNPES